MIYLLSLLLMFTTTMPAIAINVSWLCEVRSIWANEVSRKARVRWSCGLSHDYMCATSQAFWSR